MTTSLREEVYRSQGEVPMVIWTMEQCAVDGGATIDGSGMGWDGMEWVLTEFARYATGNESGRVARGFSRWLASAFVADWFILRGRFG